jgi:hypothetical protein
MATEQSGHQLRALTLESTEACESAENGVRDCNSRGTPDVGEPYQSVTEVIPTSDEATRRRTWFRGQASHEASSTDTASEIRNETPLLQYPLLQPALSTLSWFV